MKRLLGITGSVLLAVLITACSSTPVSTNTASFNNPGLGLADLTPSDYTVLGKVEGSGTIQIDKNSNEITGDTLNYGYLGSLGSAGQTYSQSKFFGLIKVTEVVTPSSPDAKARGNAVYEMIEEAEALGADAVIFVTTKISRQDDEKQSIITATVRGVAITIE